MGTGISWTDETWNPTTGCTKISGGCDHCYAERITERFHGPGSFAQVTLHPQRLEAPLRWRKPRRVFVDSMSDLFHPDVPTEFIARVFAVMGLANDHLFQILTKRHGRMRSLMLRWQRCATRGCQCPDGFPCPVAVDIEHGATWPLPNVHLGVSVEDQHWADVRVPELLATPAAARFLSCEPLLGPVNLNRLGYCWCGSGRDAWLCCARRPDWVICGGESGPGHRPMNPAWLEHIVTQCQAADLPVWVKQDSGPRPGQQGRIPDRLWIQQHPKEQP